MGKDLNHEDLQGRIMFYMPLARNMITISEIILFLFYIFIKRFQNHHIVFKLFLFLDI